MSLTDDLSDGFFRKVKVLCTNLGCDPQDMLKVWFSESIGVFADAKNPAGAYGINQMMSPTLRGSGWTGSADEYLALTAEQQLPYVEKCYTPYKARLTSAARIYQVNYLPITFDKATTPDAAIASQDDPDPRVVAAYNGNKILDSANPKKGYITLDDLKKAVENAVNSTGKLKGGGGILKDRWKEIADRLGKVPAAAVLVAPAKLTGEWEVTTPDGSFHYIFDYDGDVQWSWAYQPKALDETAGEWTLENGRLKITWQNSKEYWNLPIEPARQTGDMVRNDRFRGPISAKKVK